jgi:hypothetical protein
MPINKTKAFQTSDGQVFLTHGDAQKHEIEVLMKGWSAMSSVGGVTTDSKQEHDLRSEIAAFIINNKDALIGILATRKPRAAKPKAANGRRRNVAAVNAALQDIKP